MGMAISMKEALAAKSALRNALKSEGVEASCGVTRDGDDFAVKVNVRSGEVAGKVPALMGKVPVVVAVTGQPRAMPARKVK